MRSFFDKFKQGLKRTTPTFYAAFGKVGGLFTRTIDASSIEQLEEALIGADLGIETANEILAEIKTAWKKDSALRGQDAAKLGAMVLKRVLAGAEQPPQLAATAGHPEVICLVGVNGSGKTTTAAKLAHYYQQNKHQVVLGACDTFRAAANEQLKTWASRLGVEIVASQPGADAAAVAYDAWQAAAKRGKDVVVLDTTGRLHTKHNLMEELKKIRRVLQKHDPAAPRHRWLVLDGSLGSNSIEQARVFHKAFDLTGLVITKLDGTSRGGALVGIYRELKLPIHFVGLGEQPDDLQPFSADNFADALFGVEQ
ncbi:MAG TPA: signal recognition particle-docking protein FtsY [Opitutales bacterium]|jgi:fused signal recognition particle receptor|nr:signal recognition particle-docking protein FtsY [Opitutales bacterium]